MLFKISQALDVQIMTDVHSFWYAKIFYLLGLNCGIKGGWQPLGLLAAMPFFLPEASSKLGHKINSDWLMI